MKKMISMLAVLALLGCVSCGNNAENSPSSPSGKTESTTVESTTAESKAGEEKTEEKTESDSMEEEKATEAKADSADSENYFDWFGLNIYRPAEYTIDRSAGFPQCALLSEEDLDPMTAQGAMDYFYGRPIKKDILAAEDAYLSIKDNEVESEEAVQVNGCDFIRQAGVYHCDSLNGEIDYAYAGYFGIMDFPKLGKQPAVFIAFSHTTDDDMKKELARLVDTAAENAKPIE
ncbi:MAG: hypothetical protein IKW96_09350 [Ruminococcus sp.]|uniref:hypothetical protein n=1 Tax=Ruminococcus sp. TaxID=41978 RepID=UPI0025D4CF33|nr:hypothetical protein [Ruminococcus sp.]MBR5683457.1 hypothetical protein [Ruminococcus sp.]